MRCVCGQVGMTTPSDPGKLRHAICQRTVRQNWSRCCSQDREQSMSLGWERLRPGWVDAAILKVYFQCFVAHASSVTPAENLKR